MSATPRDEPIELGEVGTPPDRRRGITIGRRRVGGVLVAAVLLAALGVTVTRAVAGGEAGQGTGAVPADMRSPDNAPTAAATGELNGARFDALFVQFVDRDHGFALTATCADDKQPCAYGLAVSTDGGRSYQHRTLPLAKVRQLEGYSAELHAVTAGTVVIEDRGKWWVSLDAGRTWRSAPDSAARNAAGIPAAGRLHTRCADANCDTRELVVIDPETGLRSAVPDVPLERVQGTSESTVAADGTRWISGTTRGGDPALAITRDGGRTWSVSRFPEPDKLLFGPRMVVGPGKLRYAIFTVQREHVKNGFGPMYGSTDAGRTWTRIRDGEGQPASVLGAIVRPDGRLVICTELDGPMISPDGGRTFRKAETGTGLAYFVERGGMITAMGMDGTYRTSLDGGVTWAPVSVPAP
ncbi:WD40/YVTN/BNR-like repeat-containing protein [Actinoplanes regularis]|uniref:BNR/Asp-box repeat-containing protein n=1 Tax=Actinoplanes regularis TaxID=52697 RepID=A0A239BWN2_9ACTN|nr:sialidase family protein [Actinoplanes regularis]GIE88275.1 hypothetical protein Are01nite_47550 [Actinoplanes regularis]SNS11573.1 hypothetical protein SAMN06264365_110141 [Actinoplanes regularis]